MKNIILLITDTYRYDNLAGRAALPVRTPELDRFAAERATAIERFYTGSFPTIPHRTDVATGRLGWPHYGWQPLSRSSANHIGAMLGHAGYSTQLVCDCPHLFPAGFQSGFHAAYQHRGQEGDCPLLHLNDPIPEVMAPGKTRMHPLFRGHSLVDKHRWANRYPVCEQDTFPAKTGATVVRWLEENWRAAPFFLWADFFDPHEPWDPPEYLVRRYDPDYAGPPMLHPNYGRICDYTAAELANLRAHYAAEAELVDRYLGRVLQKIDDLGLWDNTIVVVTSDHGMSLGEHGRTGKSNINAADDRYWPVYPEIGHVPFLVAGGPVPRGASLDLIAQPIDILPTVAELAEVELHAPEPLHGRSFATALRQGAGTHRDLAVTGSHHPDGVLKPKAVTPFVVTARWGYTPIGADGLPELYDLKSDPGATRNVAGRYPQIVKSLQARLLEHLREHDAPASTLQLWKRETAPRRARSRRLNNPDWQSLANPRR